MLPKSKGASTRSLSPEAAKKAVNDEKIMNQLREDMKGLLGTETAASFQKHLRNTRFESVGEANFVMASMNDMQHTMIKKLGEKFDRAFASPPDESAGDPGEMCSEEDKVYDNSGVLARVWASVRKTAETVEGGIAFVLGFLYRFLKGTVKLFKRSVAYVGGRAVALASRGRKLAYFFATNPKQARM